MSQWGIDRRGLCLEIGTAGDVIPYPKILAKWQGWNMARFGTSSNPLTSRARLKSACPKYTAAERKAFKRLAEIIKRGPRGQQLREILTRAKPGCKAGAKAGVAVVAVLELAIAVYCADECGAF